MKNIAIAIETAPRKGIMDTWFPAWASRKNPGKEGDDLEDTAALYPEFGQLCAVSLVDVDSGETANYVAKDLEEERQMLEGLLDYLDQPGVVLIGHALKSFILPWMAKRYLAVLSYIPPALDVAGMKPWEVPHKDTMELMKFGGNSMSLRASCLMLGLDDPNESVDGTLISGLFRIGATDRIGEYCLKRAIATAQVYKKIVRASS